MCTAGLPSTIVDALQRGGRAIRTGNEDALFVIFYESWALEINPEEYNEGKYLHDPDRPRQDLRPSSQRRERAPYSSLRLVQSSTCIREYFAQYLNDTTESGKYVIHLIYFNFFKGAKISTARNYTTMFCCDRHQDGFLLQDHLPGKIYKEGGVKRKEAPANTSKYRPVKDRPALDLKIIAWLEQVLANDELMRSSYDILADEQRLLLLRIPPKDIVSPLSIVRALDETEEWASTFADQLFKLIHDHDASIITARKKDATERRAAVRDNGGDFILTTVKDFENVAGPSSRRAKKTKKSN